ncbi:YraN family protein [Fulvivirgaceae bacterium BMA10]|uniref:UPF0102 protein QQ008_18230 n=1 Tax=Splendidivirga corallicola TaxID=3051826 RepID=A0ABT8KRH4_9BACT|nr:YraN family protein [Fulvivirgaceae bacterium BMA10]
MAKHLKTGKKGEELAVEFLQKKGFEIIERNYRIGKAELDIIAKNENLMIFIEVKTRTNNRFGFPESFVDRRKENLITEAAEQYTYDCQWHGNIRFDIIAISLKPNLEIEHFEDAFY